MSADRTGISRHLDRPNHYESVRDLATHWTRASSRERLGSGLAPRGASARRLAIQAAQGGAGALGWADVLESLVQHRVEHLVSAVSATPDTDSLPPHISEALDDPSAGMLIEYAVASGADVTAASHHIERLLQVGGVVATLRY